MADRVETGGLRWLKRSLAVFGGLTLGLILFEIGLTIADQPRFPLPVQKSPQFSFDEATKETAPLYRNSINGQIRFVYQDNPRDYFGPNNEVIHRTNSKGFRGPEFPPTKPKNSFRMVFLGDSFTFGEGVWLADTFAERTKKLIQEQKGDTVVVEAMNLGVGGYNTEQSLQILEREGVLLLPDAVVLGFVLNDPEPPLFLKPRFATRITRRRRRMEGWFSASMPPPSVRFRISKLIWSFSAQRTRTKKTMEHYRSLYRDTYPGWQRCQRAVRRIKAKCDERKIPFCVVLFPVLYQLNNYPFEDIHAKIGQFVGKENLVDLLPAIKGRQANELWVHATDQHPNEVVHRIAAERIASHLAKAAAK